MDSLGKPKVFRVASQRATSIMVSMSVLSKACVAASTTCRLVPYSGNAPDLLSLPSSLSLSLSLSLILLGKICQLHDIPSTFSAT